MAIDEHPGYRCWSGRHRDPPPPAVGIVRETNTPHAPLEPYCQPCIDHLDSLAAAHFLVAYLDPTRQRWPQPNRSPRDLNDYPVPNDWYDAPDPAV